MPIVLHCAHTHVMNKLAKCRAVRVVSTGGSIHQWFCVEADGFIKILTSFQWSSADDWDLWPSLVIVLPKESICQNDWNQNSNTGRKEVQPSRMRLGLNNNITWCCIYEIITTFLSNDKIIGSFTAGVCVCVCLQGLLLVTNHELSKMWLNIGSR